MSFLGAMLTRRSGSPARLAKTASLAAAPIDLLSRRRRRPRATTQMCGGFGRSWRGGRKHSGPTTDRPTAIAKLCPFRSLSPSPLLSDHCWRLVSTLTASVGVTLSRCNVSVLPSFPPIPLSASFFIRLISVSSVLLFPKSLCGRESVRPSSRIERKRGRERLLWSK